MVRKDRKKHRKVLKVLKHSAVQSFFQFLRAKNSDNCLLVGTAAELFDVADQVETKLSSLSNDERLSIRQVLEKLFSYEGFRDGNKLKCEAPDWRIIWSVPKKKHEWGGWMYAETLGVRYCPYCNAESVGYGAVTDDKGQVLRLYKAAYDHVLPQGRYPYLSIALENLVPSCTRCNSVLKHEHDFLSEYRASRKIPMLHPYADNIVDHLEFSFDPACLADFYDESPGRKRLKVRAISDSEENRTCRFCAEFALEDVYGWIYSREVLEFARIAAIYSPTLRCTLEEAYPGLTKSEIDTIIYRADLAPGNENKCRFAKAIRDVRNQFEWQPVTKAEKEKIIRGLKRD